VPPASAGARGACMRRVLVLSLAMVTIAGACHTSEEMTGSGAGASASGSGGATSSAGTSTGKSTSSAKSTSSTSSGSSTASGTGGGGGGPLPLPTLDADGCPSLSSVGAQSGTLTPIPAGVTTTY